MLWVTKLIHKENPMYAGNVRMRTGLPIHVVTAELFALEIQGVVRSQAGGMFHLNYIIVHLNYANPTHGYQNCIAFHANLTTDYQNCKTFYANLAVV